MPSTSFANYPKTVLRRGSLVTPALCQLAHRSLLRHIHSLAVPLRSTPSPVAITPPATMASPTPQERFEMASRHATLLRALFAHPRMQFTAAGLPARSQIPDTLYWVTDFEVNTFRNYLLPILPPDADRNAKALAVFSRPNDVKENASLMSDDMYPRMNIGGFYEKWTDSIGRGVLISSIILEPGQQVMFGGAMNFGPVVKAAAQALLVPLQD